MFNDNDYIIEEKITFKDLNINNIEKIQVMIFKHAIFSAIKLCCFDAKKYGVDSRSLDILLETDPLSHLDIIKHADQIKQDIDNINNNFLPHSRKKEIKKLINGLKAEFESACLLEFEIKKNVLDKMKTSCFKDYIQNAIKTFDHSAMRYLQQSQNIEFKSENVEKKSPEDYFLLNEEHEQGEDVKIRLDPDRQIKALKNELEDYSVTIIGLQCKGGAFQ